MPWHDCLMPIADNFTLLEAAILECAWAGCDTIWVVCHTNTTPMVRHIVGDFIFDPVWASRTRGQFPSENQKRIPIFWIPIHPKDRDRRDCLSWSVIHGALQSLKISTQISKWVIPDKYYVSFPYGIIDPEEIRPYRKDISSAKNFYVSHDGQTVQDNIHTSFTFGKDEFIKYRQQVRKGTGMYTSKLNEDGIPYERLPLEERWSARFFELKDIFVDLDIDQATVHQTNNFYNISTWREYKNYLSSETSNKLRRPGKEIMMYREFNKIGHDPEEE